MADTHEKSSVGHEATRPSGQEGGQHEVVFLRESEDQERAAKNRYRLLESLHGVSQFPSPWRSKGRISSVKKILRFTGGTSARRCN